ncbi:hypothetical protein KC207_10335 [Phycicoccus sp. BSK3Z-2]|uniref:Polysaccharide chain length determinant N-terminal domain-containing protein n=1 Tax=Phycicoccus avicenniae TaxID=2828860 RepID=A0A941D8U6_9MICO|nr:hypothetical protein [Phycicoccus avicenniae]MBR7743686.1 hypothetical protein [Phycicoccus avicenniae]
MANRGLSGPRSATLEVALRSSTRAAVVLALLGTLVGGLVGLRESDIETAGASVLVNPLDGNPFSTSGSGDDLINMVSESELVRSDAVATRVRDDLAASESSSDLLRGLTVDVPPNSQIVEITYETPEGGRSAALAQSFAEQYLAYRQNRAEDLATSQQEQIQQQIEDRLDEQATLATRLGGLEDGSADASVVQAQLDAVASQINQLRARAGDIDLVPTNPGQVVTPAEVQPRGLLGSWVAYPVAGLVGGLVLALGVALVRARLDNHIHHPDDVGILGHSLLAVVSAEESERIVASFEDDPTSTVLTENYRALRVNLLTATQQRPLVVLLATGSASDRTPTSALPLMLTLAASRLDAVLVDTVGALPSDESPLDARAPALSELLASEEPLDYTPHEVLPHGSLIRRGGALSIDDFFMTHRMETIMESLRDWSDVVVIAAGSIHDSKTRALASISDVVVVEAISGESTFTDLVRAGDDLSSAREKLLGVVLVEGVERRGSAVVRRPGRADETRGEGSAAVVRDRTSPTEDTHETRETPDATADGERDDPRPGPGEVEDAGADLDADTEREDAEDELVLGSGAEPSRGRGARGPRGPRGPRGYRRPSDRAAAGLVRTDD